MASHQVKGSDPLDNSGIDGAHITAPHNSVRRGAPARASRRERLSCVMRGQRSMVSQACGTLWHCAQLIVAVRIWVAGSRLKSTSVKPCFGAEPSAVVSVDSAALTVAFTLFIESASP